MKRFVPLLLLFVGLPAHAVSTRTWRVTNYKDFDEGEANGVLLSSLGDASSGFGSSRVEVPEAEVFSSATAPDGTVWLGTGDQAELYAWDGKATRKVARLDGVNSRSPIAFTPVAAANTLGDSPSGAKAWSIRSSSL